jgi:uncharacterized protein
MSREMGRIRNLPRNPRTRKCEECARADGGCARCTRLGIPCREVRDDFETGSESDLVFVDSGGTLWTTLLQCDIRNGCLPAKLASNLLIWAATYGHNEVLRTLLDLKVSVNNHGYHDLMALHHAARSGYKPVLRALLAAGANVNLQTKYGETALHLACFSNNSNAALVSILLAAGANVNLKTESGKTALHLACFSNNSNAALVSILLAAGANVNLQTESGDTALLACIYNNDTTLVPILLEAGANVNLKTKSGEAALHIACRKYYTGIVQILLSAGADVNLANSSGYTALHIVCQEDNAHLIPILAAAEADVNLGAKYTESTPLHIACLQGKVQLVNAMLNAGAFVDANDHVRQTPLHHAVSNGHGTVAAILLEANANINIGRARCTALHIAVKRGNSDMVELLYKSRDLDVNAVDYLGRTALHNALLLFKGNKRSSVVRALMQHSDVKIDIREYQGSTAFDIAISQGDWAVVEIFKNVARGLTWPADGSVEPWVSHI